MDLLTELNKVLLLEGRPSNTIAMIQVRSPLNPPQVQYRIGPVSSKTSHIPIKGVPQQVHYPKLLRSSLMSSWADTVANNQLKGLEERKTNSGSDVRQKIITRDAVIDLAGRGAGKDEWLQIKKAWGAEREELRRAAVEEVRAAERRLENRFVGDDRQKKMARAQALLTNATYEKQESRIEYRLRGTPLGLTYAAWSKRDYSSFDSREIELALENGYQSNVLHNVLRQVNDPAVAQFSRDFDSVVAVMIFDMFLDPNARVTIRASGNSKAKYHPLTRRVVRQNIQQSGPNNVAVGKRKQRATQFINSGPASGDLNRLISHQQLFTLLMSGYQINELRTELSKQYIETRKTGPASSDVESTNDDSTITNSVKRIWADQDKYFNLDNKDLDGGAGDPQIYDLKTDWHTPEDLYKDPVVQAHLERGLKSGQVDSDVGMRPTFDAPSPRTIWDLPREIGDNRPRVSDVQHNFMENQDIPKFVWVVLTGFEGSEDKGIRADKRLSMHFGQPVAWCPDCRGGRSPKETGCTTCFSPNQKGTNLGKGLGADPEAKLQRCRQCEGVGRTRKRCAACSKKRGWTKACSECTEIDCTACGGEGETPIERNLTVRSGVVPAWYWANEPKYPSHVGFNKKNGEEDRTPFEKIYQTVFLALKKKFGKGVSEYDGVHDQAYPLGELGGGMRIPWHIAPPSGQKRPIYAENVPSYTVVFAVPLPRRKSYGGSKESFAKVKFLELEEHLQSLGLGRNRGEQLPEYADRLQNSKFSSEKERDRSVRAVRYYGDQRQAMSREFDVDMISQFRPFLNEVVRTTLKGKGFYVDIEAGASALIKAEKIEVGLRELTQSGGIGSDWSDPNQPSDRFVEDMFELYRIAVFLDRVRKFAPHLWKALGVDPPVDSAVPYYIIKQGGFPPDTSLINCLKATKAHIKKGLSFHEAYMIRSDVKSKIRGETGSPNYEIAKAQRESGSDFPGMSKVLGDLEKIIDNAEIYDYTFDAKMPTRVNHYMRSQVALQSMYDSHIFGMPQQRTQEESDRAEEAGGRKAAGAQLASDIHGVSATMAEGGLVKRGKLSKREHILTIARRIERILEYANVYHLGQQDPDDVDINKRTYEAASYHMPHYNVYLAMGWNYVVPDNFIENNIKSRIYDVVKSYNSDDYGEYLLGLQGEDSDTSSHERQIRDSLEKLNVDLNVYDTLKAFYSAQSPQLALVHLEAAVFDLEQILEEDRFALSSIDVIFHSEGQKGAMDVGVIGSDPKDGYVKLNTEKGPKDIEVEKLDNKVTAEEALAECARTLIKYQKAAESRLRNKKEKRRQRDGEENAKRYIQGGGAQGDYFSLKSERLEDSINELAHKKDEGEATPKEIAELNLFVELRDLFYTRASGLWASGNDYGSLHNIKDRFVSWFKKQRFGRQYAKYELDIAELGSGGVKVPTVVLNTMLKEIRRITDSSQKPGHASKVIRQILNEK